MKVINEDDNFALDFVKVKNCNRFMISVSLFSVIKIKHKEKSEIHYKEANHKKKETPKKEGKCSVTNVRICMRNSDIKRKTKHFISIMSNVLITCNSIYSG